MNKRIAVAMLVLTLLAFACAFIGCAALRGMFTGQAGIANTSQQTDTTATQDGTGNTQTQNDTALMMEMVRAQSEETRWLIIANYIVSPVLSAGLTLIPYALRKWALGSRT